MALKVKTCGLTNLEDARFCAVAGADFLGFIQYPRSPRYVEPAVAKEIIQWVYGPETVGVFVNEEAEVVNRVTETVNFSMVQLHGTEPPAVCARIERPVIKAIRVEPTASADDLHRSMAPYRDHVAYYLFDTHAPHLWGGTGTSFDWKQVRDLSEEFPILLAGGIHAGNVEQAVRTVHPLGVDLSSGIESAPGTKDFDKVSAFFEAVNAFKTTLEKETPGESRTPDSVPGPLEQ
ncbi:MAG: phosphoribosylanthranilate isomerase [Rhodothermales bacterium]